MARNQKIYFVFVDDALDGLIKLGATGAPTPHAGKAGDFLWVLTNNTPGDIVVTLRNFTNPGGANVDDFLDFKPKSRSKKIPAFDSDTIFASVKKVNVLNVPFTYEVWVGTKMIDPELIVDGGGGGVPGPKAKKAGKKKKR